jgi:dihydroorotase
MKNSYRILNGSVVNEGSITPLDILIVDGMIAQIAAQGALSEGADYPAIDATGLHVFPGLIDDQVHFREPGLTHKGEIATEAAAAVAGGITSYMEMPNTSPPSTTIELLEEKYQRASEVSLANYSFFMGTTNGNVEELLKVDPRNVCGVKIFLGSSTGDMLVDEESALDEIFSKVKTLIALHCEDDPMIKRNLEAAKAQYGEDVPVTQHGIIRSAEACYSSSSKAIARAKKFGTRLHVLHISTAIELDLFDANIPLEKKQITSEACTHHLWFTDEDYTTKGNFIKWNPAVKTANDRMNIRQAVVDGRIDVLATDHAPHTIEEKSQSYLKAPSGGPLVQHNLLALLDLVKQGVFTLELIAQKASHNVATIFQIDRRGFIREGYFADLVLVNLNKPYAVSKDNILSKCGWSPFEGHVFGSTIEHTLVNGFLAYSQGALDHSKKGERLHFNRL